MGLRIRHNGIITDISGAEYDPGTLGTMRMKIRTGSGVKEYGLTTDPTATRYCGLNFRINGNKYHVGRKETHQYTQALTSQGYSTRQGEASRVSDYTVSEPLYTYTYEAQTYAKVTPSKTVYQLSYVTANHATASRIAYLSTSSSSHYYGTVKTQSGTWRGWNYVWSSTNGVISSRTYDQWAPSYNQALTSSAANTSSYYKDRQTTGPFVTFVGKFKRGTGTTSINSSFTWSNIHSATWYTITAKSTVNATSPCRVTLGTTEWGETSGVESVTSSLPSAASQSRKVASQIGQSAYTSGQYIWSYEGSRIYETRGYGSTGSYYSSSYMKTTLTSDSWISSSSYSYWTTRKSYYTYQSDYTYSDSYTVTRESTTHNFV